MKRSVFSLAVALALAACAEQPADRDSEVAAKARAFAVAYFNYDLREALRHVAPESEKWVRYEASILTQEDVDAINAAGLATVSVGGVEWTDDSTATVGIGVSDYVMKDSIGSACRVVGGGEFRLTVVTRRGVPSVRMACPLRSERQGRD